VAKSLDGFDFREFVRQNTKKSLCDDGQFSGFLTGRQDRLNFFEAASFLCDTSYSGLRSMTNIIVLKADPYIPLRIMFRITRLESLEILRISSLHS
jgi:hypothetical protein